MYFKDVWAYMDSGIQGDIISSDDQLELEWDENFENVTTKCDDNLWISHKVYYIKHDSEGREKMYKLDKMNEEYVSRSMRNQERIKKSKEMLKKKNKIKTLIAGEKQYLYNRAYRVKVDTLLQYAILSKNLCHGYLLHSRFNDLKVGIYLACLANSIIMVATGNSFCFSSMQADLV